jgi:hypothetical protein
MRHHGGEYMMKETAYLVARKQRERGQGQGLNVSFKGTSQCPTSSKKPYFLKFSPPLRSTTSWRQSLLGDI